MLRISYPLPVFSEEAVIGNPGYKTYGYRVAWKGDTVVGMEPLGPQYKTGYSDFDEREVPIFYGKEGPGPIYEREFMLGSEVPQHVPLHEDRSPIDFWNLK